MFVFALCVVGGSWSAFEHTVTPLDPGVITGSFLSLVPWNSGNETSAREPHLSSIPPDSEKKTSVCSSDINSQSFHMSTPSHGISQINAGVRQPSSAASCISSSQLLASSSANAVNITSSAQMLHDVVNCNIIASWQIVDVGQNLTTSHQGLDQIAVGKPPRGKENTPPSHSSLDLLRINARKWSDLENRSASIKINSSHDMQHTKHQGGLGSLNEWRSPLRHSANNANKNVGLTQSQLFQSHQELTNTREAFAALTFVSSDSFADSYIDHDSPSKFFSDGLGTRSDGAQKRSSSTPVKDRNLHEPIRFRRHLDSRGSDELVDQRGKSSTAEVAVNDQHSQSVAAEVTQVNDRRRQSSVSDVITSVVQLNDQRRRSSSAKANTPLTQLNEQSSASPTDNQAESGKSEFHLKLNLLENLLH